LVRNELPWYEMSYLGAKWATLVRNELPWYEMGYLGTK